MSSTFRKMPLILSLEYDFGLLFLILRTVKRWLPPCAARVLPAPLPARAPWLPRGASAKRRGRPKSPTPGLRRLRLPTVIGQFHTLFFGSVQMFFLGVLGFAVYGNEALHFSCEPDKREVNLFCYNQFRPITPQVFWALQLVTVLVPGAVFHLYAACRNIDQEDILQKPTYTVFYILLSVLLRIVLEVVAFWLQSHLFGFQVNPLYRCDAGALDKKINITRCMVPEHFEKTIFLIAMYTFTVITVVLCVAEIFEILCRRLGFLNNQ
ncbi:putative gap junction epsilon-1 protein [Dermochelys coriacea]|uniref:putative gap junction epsilon-1 protein n=1 Tax=Dermochelys coriacea TaxID=27794 RepID=UPI001CA7F756|nr:putative gap junction epsilon-1 protein [Dermochelys coriacea]